jgi:hypothetical protein
MSFSKLAAFITLAAIATPALAHIEMKSPPPLRSAFNPQYKDGPIQDTYTNPLNKDGSNYPCKGFAGDVPSMSQAVATLNAGSSFTVELAGSAVHGGGSCQFAVSYDAGMTWGVLHSIVGNCPTEGASYTFDVPAGLPSAKNVLFAWTWFNKVGNREMYMNCAAVDVMGSSGSIELPKMFEANHFADQCTTPDSQDVDFAKPTLNNCPADKLVTPDMKVTIGSGPAAPAPPPSTSTMTSSMPMGNSTSTGGSMPPAQTGMPSSGGAMAWAADKVYNSGDMACQMGKSYTARWWTMGETPGSAEVWGTAGAAC